jgi:hypothetical protein
MTETQEAMAKLRRDIPADGLAVAVHLTIRIHQNGAMSVEGPIADPAFCKKQGSNTESQVIVPSYVANHDEIFAVPVPHTGVMESGRELTLMDLNIDGRAWAKKDGT